MLPTITRKSPISHLLDNDFFSFKTNLFETDTSYTTDKEGQTVLQIDVPGFNKDNLKVEISEGVLTIQGETETRKIFKQYTMGSVQDVNASIKDGVLSLTLVEPEKTSTRVEITS
jgi:HSP20 family molecular chaperone IbpA